MPSPLHQALTEIFRQRPRLAAELLTDALGMDLPAFQEARLESSDLTDLTPTEYRADAVVLLTNGPSVVLAVVVEVQLGRDKDKRWSWPVYVCTLRARLRCPTVLLVVCPDGGTAGWCAAPIELGHPGLVLRPLVLGPDRLPVVTDVDLACRLPELAVLSAMAHVAHPDWLKVADVLLSALRTVEPDRADLYTDVVFAALPVAARRTMEAMMTARALMSTRTYEYQSEFARRYFLQGRAEGERVALLTILDARGIDVPDQARDRILGCTDLEQFDVWIRRAATARAIDDLFA